MQEPMGWRTRTATVTDAEALTDVVIEATKHQGRWPPMSDAEETRWRERYVAWTLQTIDARELSVIVDGDGRTIGRLRVLRHPDASGSSRLSRLELAGVQLLPTAQGHGIGTALVRGLQREAATYSVPLELGVEKDNPRARRLYERLGFQHTGESASEHLMRWGD